MIQSSIYLPNMERIIRRNCFVIFPSLFDIILPTYQLRRNSGRNTFLHFEVMGNFSPNHHKINIVINKILYVWSGSKCFLFPFPFSKWFNTHKFLTGTWLCFEDKLTTNTFLLIWPPPPIYTRNLPILYQVLEWKCSLHSVHWRRSLPKNADYSSLTATFHRQFVVSPYTTFA